MKALTAEQYQIALDTQRNLVRRGLDPVRAGAIVRRALGRAKTCCGSCSSGKSCCEDGGLGRLQVRSLRRDLDPSIKPRPVISGEQCVRIQETPGNETAIYSRLSDYRNRGWNVMEVSRTHGYPSVRVYWACPPGRVPMEAQGQVLSSGVGATMVPSGPVAIKTGETISDQAPPTILANIASAGDDPTVSAARNVVSKWSFVIPVVSLLMSAKNKLTGGGSPTSAAIVKTGRSR